METTASGIVSAQTQQADIERTKRAFVGFLGSVLGVDQTYANEDQYVGNAPGQYVIANPDGTYSAMGRSSSNLQSVAPGFAITPALILIGLVAFFALKKG